MAISVRRAAAWVATALFVAVIVIAIATLLALCVGTFGGVR